LPGQGAVDASESGDGAGPDPLTFEQKPWQEKDSEEEHEQGQEGNDAIDGKTADLTLDCQVHMRGDKQSSEPAHEIRL
jgi:hypothetical protein